MQGIGTNTIETKRLILRRMEATDALMIYNNWASDTLVTRYLTWNTHQSLDVTKEYVDYKVNRYPGHEYCFDWVVALKDTNELIGEIEAIEVSRAHKLVEMGYCFGSKYWNQGYATEALIAFLHEIMPEKNVDKVYGICVSENFASKKVLEKSGFIKEYEGVGEYQGESRQIAKYVLNRA